MFTKEMALATVSDADQRTRLAPTHKTAIGQWYLTRQGEIVGEQEANYMLVTQYVINGLEIISRAFKLS